MSVWRRLIRGAFWLLYNPLAWAYDGVSWLVSQGQWRAWQRAALPELCGPCVLELAFGTGHMLVELRATHMRPVGLDLSPAMARIAQHRLRAAARPCAQAPSVPLVRGRAQAMPFAAASFDSVLCTFPAPFIALPATLREVARVLPPGGRAVLVPMSHLDGEGLWSAFLEWLYRITGQRGPLPDLGPELEALGLTCRAEWKPVGRSSACVIVCEKG
jgi:ubiquinone/menaquinone biosynthesis C-methylase UbiE